METLNKLVILVVLIATPATAARFADVMDAISNANAENAECLKEGHSQRYCEWRFNKRHWPLEETSPYWTFEEYMRFIKSREPPLEEERK